MQIGRLIGVVADIMSLVCVEGKLGGSPGCLRCRYHLTSSRHGYDLVLFFMKRPNGQFSQAVVERRIAAKRSGTAVARSPVPNPPIL